MDRLLDVLSQTEQDPSRMNDEKGKDLFRILENFIREALSLSAAGLTRRQLYQFLVALAKYLASKPGGNLETQTELEFLHLER